MDMNLKDYITELIGNGSKGNLIEAVSSGRHKSQNGTFTDEMNISQFIRQLERCGINWCAKLKYEQKIDDGFMKQTMKDWNYMYDVEPLFGGEQLMVVVTLDVGFVLYWDIKSKNNYIKHAAVYEMKGNSVAKTEGVDETLEKMNKEITPDLF